MVEINKKTSRGMNNIECIARGIIRRDDLILLCHGKGKENWFFPGGHMEPGESAVRTLSREIDEEIGEKCDVGEFLGVSENKYSINGSDVNEVNLVFEVLLITDNGQVSQEDHLEFKWFTRDEMRNLLIYPKKLKDAIIRGEKGFVVSEGFN